MKRHQLLALVFLAVALLQIALPASRIWEYERTLREGNVYKFKTAPVDPYDAFRGRYVALRFEQETVVWKGKEKPAYDTPVFVKVEMGPDGFAKFGEASLEAPAGGDYLRLLSSYGYRDDELSVKIPFDRFYMEENIAPAAERAYIESNRRGSAQSAYAMIRIRQGLGVIEQVFVGDKTLADTAKAALQAGTK